ncbi:ATP synthase F0 subunit C [Ureaplasma canigenitalium]|uniref:ATP synthase F0 subunit C n=1 Tax=Ureaplasma canigenitalium TaxID=42092 RepID=UPI0004E0ED03|nr:ATP synthase F0 subunit C [Ureaplasma canigenitalium]
MSSFIDITGVIASHLETGALPNIEPNQVGTLQNGASIAYLGKYVGAAMTMWAAGFVGVMQGFSTSQAVNAVARNPEAQPKILSTMIVGLALAEAVAIYALIIAILIVFVA